MSGGGGTTTSNTSTTVPPDVLKEYNQVVAQANQVSSAPLQQYSGQIVADLNPSETSAFNTIDNMQGITAPYTQQANNLINSSTQNIDPRTVTAADIQNYSSPYTQQVLQSAIAAQNNQDAQQQEQLKGNAISAGAWGGDRAGVAQGILGGQQAIANNATNAGILNQGYAQALQEANAQQQVGVGAQEASQYLQESGGLAENQLGVTALSNGLTGANAQLSSGQLQQQQSQSQLNVPYEQFLQQQAYPFQTTGWLGNIAEGIGSNEGGNSTSSTQQPSQGLFGFRKGGTVPGRSSGGIAPKHFDTGGGGIMSALYDAESGGDPNAISSAGAQGIAQIMPDTARQPGFGVAPLQGWDGVNPRTAPVNEQKRFATDYHDAMLKRFGNEPEALMAYNGGPGTIDKLQNGEITMSDLPAETQAYPGRVLGDNTDYYARDSQQSNGIAPPPTPPVNAPDHPSNSGYIPEMPATHEANPWLSVAAGVLGTLAGRSRNPLVDIGQGGLIGLNNYAQQTKEADEQNYREGSFKNNAQKLMQEADDAKQKFAQEKTNESDLNSYRTGELANQTKQLEQGKNEVVKDMFGQPAGTYDKKTGKFTPLDTGTSGQNNAVKDVDGTPLTPFQMYGYKNLITKQQPKDMAAEQGVLNSMYDQKIKVDDMAKQIPIASSGSLHSLADFADKNQIPIFSDPVRGAATVAAAYDNMGNVLDSIRPTFSGTGRVLKAEFDALKNELSAAKDLAPEQKAVVIGKIQAKIADLLPMQAQYAKDVQNGTAYLPSYESPVQKKLDAQMKGVQQSAVPTPAKSPTIIKYDANGNRVQ